jgi:hypothetical protein
MNNKFWRVGKEEYVATFELLSRRLPKGNDESHETPQLGLPGSWPMFELDIYSGKITSVTGSASLDRESYRCRIGRYTTLDLPKLTVLHEACKLSSCLMISLLHPAKFRQYLQIPKQM